MKRICLIAMVISFALNSYSQITLEKSYEGELGLSIIKLENSGFKYLQYDVPNLIVKLYNMDHSLFKTINLPILEPKSNSLSISYISENLFNSDNLIELVCLKGAYELTYFSNTGSIKIINENGSVIFSEDSMVVAKQRDVTYYGYDDNHNFIYNTSSGTKMILYSYKKSDIGFKVYSLPGTPVTIVKTSSLEKKVAYPNPAQSQITIPYDLGESSIGLLTVFDANGKEVKQLKIDKTFSNVLLDVNDLKNGLYVYSIKNEYKLISNGKFIVNK